MANVPVMITIEDWSPDWAEKFSRKAAAIRAAIGQLAPKKARAETCLGALQELIGQNPWLAGPDLSLADLHAAPMFDLFLRTPEGADLLPRHGRLADSWSAVAARASFAATID